MEWKNQDNSHVWLNLCPIVLSRHSLISVFISVYLKYVDGLVRISSPIEKEYLKIDVC